MLLAVGIFMGVLSGRDVIDSFKTPLNYNLMDASDVKDGAVVEGNLFVNYGSYEEQYTTGRFGNRTGGSSYWYMIPVGEEEFMGIFTGNKELIATLNRQADETWASINEETDAQPTVVHFKGKVVKMDSEDEAYFRNFMEEIGFTSEEIRAYGISSYIKIIFYDNMWISLVISVVSFLAGAAILIILFIRKRQGL